MRVRVLLMLIMSSINLSACSSMSGNVVPEKGPTMEEVYDSVGRESPHKNISIPPKEYKTLSLNAVDNEFHKVPNPELRMYVFPHLAGKDEVPIPGYFTVFNAYTQDHYALPLETIREQV